MKSKSNEMETRIMKAVGKPDYQPLPLMALYDALCGAEDENHEHLDPFAEAVDRLLAAGKLVRTKRGALRLPSNETVVIGQYQTGGRDFGFVVREDEAGPDLFIPGIFSACALQGDTVRAAITAPPRPGKQSPEGKILEILEHHLKTVIGELCRLPAQRHQPARYYVQPDEKKIRTEILIDYDAERNLPPLGSKVEVTLTSYPSQPGDVPHGIISGVFGESGTPKASYTAILHTCGIPDHFDPPVLAEAEKAAERPVLPDGRLDLRGETIFTIDGPYAKDLDDAISLTRNPDGTWLLGVHIADVSEYVRENSALDREAFQRGTSVYFVDQVVPMLPETISNGCCSLHPGVDRYALSALITLRENGEIAETELRESVIHTVVRGVYGEMNDVAALGRESEFYDKYKPVEETFQRMQELYHVLEERSHQRGALEMETNEASFRLDADGKPVEIIREELGLCQKMIEQFMLCANEGVASWLHWQHMPCVYRVHDEPNPEKLQAFSVFALNLGLDISGLRAKRVYPSVLDRVLRQAKERGMGTTVSYVMLRAMAKARYDSTLSPHFGLALERYCHFTSPIRRYPDLMVHRFVKTVLHGEMQGETLIRMQEAASLAAKQSSICEERAVTAERQIESLYKVWFMQDKVGQIFDGTISSVLGFGFFVELDNTCEGLVPIASLDGFFEYDENTLSLRCGRKIFRLGNRVRVQLVKADLTTCKLDLQYVGRPGEEISPESLPQ